LMTWVWGRWTRTEGSGDRAGLCCIRVNRDLKKSRTKSASAVWIGFPTEHERRDTWPRRTARADKAGFRGVRVNRVSKRPQLLLLLGLKERRKQVGNASVWIGFQSRSSTRPWGKFFFLGEFSAIWILCLFLCPFRNLGEPILPIQKFGWAHSAHSEIWVCPFCPFRNFPSGHLTRHNGHVLGHTLHSIWKVRIGDFGLFWDLCMTPVLRSKITEGPVLRSFSYVKKSWDFFTFWLGTFPVQPWLVPSTAEDAICWKQVS
jgi:hypothetical protein